MTILNSANRAVYRPKMKYKNRSFITNFFLFLRGLFRKERIGNTLSMFLKNSCIEACHLVYKNKNNITDSPSPGRPSDLHLSMMEGVLN